MIKYIILRVLTQLSIIFGILFLGIFPTVQINIFLAVLFMAMGIYLSKQTTKIEKPDLIKCIDNMIRNSKFIYFYLTIDVLIWAPVVSLINIIKVYYGLEEFRLDIFLISVGLSLSVCLFYLYKCNKINGKI